MPTETRPERAAKLTENVLETLGEPNRKPVREFITDLRRRGRRPSTVLKNAKALGELDAFAHGQPITSLTPEDYRTFLDHLETRMQWQSTYQYSITIKHYLRETLDLDALPRDIRRALRIGEPKKFRNLQPLNQDELVAMLEARPNLRDQCLLWVLWDSGMRGGEIAALRVGSVLFDQRGGARLSLPPDAAGLKTGPRTIPVVDCVPALRAWLSVHPAAGDLEAPLFPQLRGFARNLRNRVLRSLMNEGVWGIVHKAAIKAKLRRIWPHLFRHSRATRAAQAGWTPSEMEKFFGWKPGSRIASIYVHLNIEDLERRVRRDAGIDESGFLSRSSALDDAAMEAKLKRTLRKLLTEDA